MSDIDKLRAALTALEPFNFAAKFSVNDDNSRHLAYGIVAGDLRRAAEAYAALSDQSAAGDGHPVADGWKDVVKRLREGRIESIEECFVTEVGATTQLQLDAADLIERLAAAPASPAVDRRAVLEEEDVERVAKAIAVSRGIELTSAGQITFPNDGPVDFTDAQGRTFSYLWRKSIPHARAAIRALAPTGTPHSLEPGTARNTRTRPAPEGHAGRGP